MASNEEPKDNRITETGKALYPFWKGQPIIVKLALIIAVATVVVVASVLVKNPWKHETATQAQETHGDNSPAIMSARDVYVGGAVVPSQAPSTKDKIRAYLRALNPEIVKQLDAGAASVDVMINTSDQPALRKLQEDPDFGAFLIVRERMDKLTVGGHNKVKGFLNDLNDVGTLIGFTLEFKEKLRL
jgi:hypothetical protein